MKKYRKFILLAFVLLFTIALITFFYYYSIYSKDHENIERIINKAYQEVETLAEIDDIDYFTGDKEYYFIFGRNNIDIPMLIWLNDEEIHKIYLVEWVDKEEIKQKTAVRYPDISIKRINAGIMDKELIYEVLYEDEEERLGYLYFKLKNGDFIKRYRLGKVL